MKVSLLQLNTQPDRGHNLREVGRLMTQALETEQPDLIVLPEHFDWVGGTAEQKRAAADFLPDGEAYRMLQDFAARHRVWIHGGSLLERTADKGRICNTTVVFDPSGREVGRYRKIHLFDITAPDGKIYRESETVSPGDNLVIYEAHGFRIGCAICYDLRFPGLFDALAGAQVDAVVLPAAFTLQTGKAHWDVLCRARAIELQAYFLACGQWGAYRSAGGEERRTYGNSLICDPWGEVIARAPDKVGIVSAQIELARVAAVRAMIPMAEHRVDFARISTAQPSCNSAHAGACKAPSCLNHRSSASSTGG